MGRASDLTIRGVFLPWSDWNIEGPPYVDLPLEERAQLVFSTLFGLGPNGASAVNVSAAKELTSLQPACTAVTQQVTHAVNNLVLPAPGTNLRNVLCGFQVGIGGTGTAPSQAAPVVFTISDGATIIYQWRLVAFTNVPVIIPAGAGIAGSLNTAMTLSCPDPGLNNNSTINAMYIVR